MLMCVFFVLNLEINELFDFSYSVLCSVLLIYCEYLINMGVCVSMSIFIVVGGKFWGLFFCYYMLFKLIFYLVCMLFQIFFQVCSVIVECLEQGCIVELLCVFIECRLVLVCCVWDVDDLFGVLVYLDDGIVVLIFCDGVLVMFGGCILSICGDFECQVGNVL